MNEDVLPMQKIYYNGSIVTMCDGCPSVEAVLTENGRIAAVGAMETMRAQAPRAGLVDLEGCALMPAFLDSHGHFMGAANARLQVPLGEAASLDDIVRQLRAFIDTGGKQPGEWIVADGYDHTALAERRHPDRGLLDAVSGVHPLVLKHKSGHLGVMNSAALAALGITAQTQPPEGGVIGVADGELTGYLEETAFIEAIQRVPMPDMDELMRAVTQTQRTYASYGITTAQEGMLAAALAPMYRTYMDACGFYLDMVVYPSPADMRQVRAALPGLGRAYERHVRLGGYKIFLDGTPQGGTAWVTEPYLNGGSCGTQIMQDADVLGAIELAASERMQILAHCNGDAAAGQYLRALAEAERRYPILSALRPVMIHAQLLRPDQLPEARRLGVMLSFFAAHVYYWGDVHEKNLGSARAQRISPARSALENGVVFTLHQDAPVIAPNMLETVWCAVNRVTRGGRRFAENIDVWNALKAVTINAAYQYHEEAQKGSIAAGKRADFVLLDRNPLTVRPEDIRSIRVLETIKDGARIFSR